MGRRRGGNDSNGDGDASETGSDDAPTVADPSDTPQGVDDEALARLVDATNALAFDLHGELVASAPGENLVSSPVSVATALAMAYAGARGETREAMRQALRLTLDDETLHAAFEALRYELDERGEAVEAPHYGTDDEPVPFQLDVVDAVWGQAEYPFRDDYRAILHERYGGGLREVDFRDDPAGARERINAWVAEGTEGRIDDLLPEGALDALARLVLTDAVYFRANWHYPFDGERTDDAPFTALDGSATTVPTMRQHETFPYAELDGAQAVDLPYLGRDVSMLVILPPDGAFESYEEALDAAAIERLVDALEPRDGTVELPRFAFESALRLETVLASLGMSVAFDDARADFSGMADLERTDGTLFIDGVYHETAIAVDEHGTEAAAASAVIATESLPLDPFAFVADRPFLFAIRDRPTGAVLFLGRVVNAARFDRL